jgi:hypothetical protein
MSMRATLVGALALGAAAAAAILLNLLLLGGASAGDQPLGRLTPRTKLPASTQWTIRPAHGHVNDEGADD